jgi:hypothetical protein
LRQDRWLFLFNAIIAACALAVFFKIDILTVMELFGTVGQINFFYTSRDVVLAVLLAVLFCLGIIGFYSSKGKNVPHLTLKQKRLLLNEVTKMRTLMTGILIASTNGDPDTEPLAHDFADVFNRAGIEPWFTFTRPDNPAQLGVTVCVRDLDRPPSATEDLKSALKEARVPFTVSGFPQRGFGGIDQSIRADHDLVIWMAPRPL